MRDGHLLGCHDRDLPQRTAPLAADGAARCGRCGGTLDGRRLMRVLRFAVASRFVAFAAGAALLSGACLAQQHDPVGRIAAEDAELSTQAAAAATALDRAGAEVHALGREFAETVIGESGGRYR